MLYVPMTDQDRYRFVMKTKLKEAFRTFGINGEFDSTGSLNLLKQTIEAINKINQFDDLKAKEDKISTTTYSYDGLSFYGFQSFYTYSNPVYGPIAIYARCGVEIQRAIVKRLKELVVDGGDQSIIGQIRTKTMANRQSFIDLVFEESDRAVMKNLKALTEEDEFKITLLMEMSEEESPHMKRLLNNIENRFVINFDNWVQSEGFEKYKDFLLQKVEVPIFAVEKANNNELLMFLRYGNVVFHS